MAYNVVQPFSRMSTEGEGNYASTIDRDTDQGLTLSPKIESDESSDQWALDVDNLTHEDIERFLGSGDFQFPSGEDNENVLNPVELDFQPEEVHEDTSWVDALLYDGEPPSKKKKLTPPPRSVNEQIVSHLLTFRDVAQYSNQSNSRGQSPMAQQPLAYTDAPESSDALEVSHAEPNKDQMSQNTENGTTTEPADTSRNVSPAMTIDIIAKRMQVLVEPNRTYQSPYLSTRPQYPQIPENSRAFSAKGSQQPDLDHPCYSQPIRLERERTPLYATQEGSQGCNSDIEGDDGSLFGDDGDIEEESNPFASVDDETRIARSSAVPLVQCNPPPENMQTRKSSTVHLVDPHSSTVDIALISSTPRISGVHLSPSEPSSAVTYPTPSASPLDPDSPMLSVEKDSLSMNVDASRLRNHVHQIYSIPYMSKKAAGEYAAQHGFPGVVKQDKSSIPVERFTASTTSNDQGHSSAHIDLTLEAPTHPRSPQCCYHEESIYEQLICLLRAKLTVSCTQPHTVPQDLAMLFESLERKLDQDENFRKSVLTWALSKMEKMRKSPLILQ